MLATFNSFDDITKILFLIKYKIIIIVNLAAAAQLNLNRFLVLDLKTTCRCLSVVSKKLRTESKIHFLAVTRLSSKSSLVQVII